MKVLSAPRVETRSGKQYAVPAVVERAGFEISLLVFGELLEHLFAKRQGYYPVNRQFDRNDGRFGCRLLACCREFSFTSATSWSTADCFAFSVQCSIPAFAMKVGRTYCASVIVFFVS